MSLGVEQPRQEERVATSAAAPFPEEHTERNGFHHVWVPATTPADHLCGTQALNLRCDAIGMGGDWHARWEVPTSGIAWHAHQWPTSATFLHRRNGNQHLNELIGADEVADARPALQEVGHPAGSRSVPVWCATHARAVIEMAWHQIWAPDPPPRRITIDPRNIAVWISAIDEWRQLHRLATTIQRSFEADNARRNAWSAWKELLTPRALSKWPPPKWQGLEAEGAWLERETAKWHAALQGES